MQDQDPIQTMQEVAVLFFRKLRGTIDPAGEQQLEAWLAAQSGESRKFYEQLSDQQAIESSLRSFYSIDEEAALQDVLSRMQKDSHETNSSSLLTVIPVRRSWYRYAAAAAIGILIVGIATTLWLTSRTDRGQALPSPTAQYNSDALPGGDKAILQLEDGSAILLDTASGELAKQGQTRVLKNADGVISYDAGRPGTDTAMVYNRIITPRGGQYQVSLPDGSKVWLNAASSLRFPVAFKGKERVVELTGEAYFEVAQNATKPFKVTVGGIDEPMQVEVLGTGFNIQAYADEPVRTATLVNGKVKVSNGNAHMMLSPGQQASLKNQQLQTATAELEEVLAWKNGIFYLQDADINTIMRQLSRWYDVEVVYEGSITQQFVGKIPRTMNLSDVLRVLESTGWVHFKFEGKTVTVSP
jgi:ferric-dicitrate binding protein FerR (iron transport regulator)